MKMTRQELKRKWIVILFFSSLFLIFSYLLYYLTTGTYDPSARRWVSRTEARDLIPQGAGNFVLKKKQHTVTGNLKITYLGMAAGAILIDLVILDLDPVYAYRYRIPVAKAKKEFLLSNSRFRASSVTPDNIRLERRP